MAVTEFRETLVARGCSEAMADVIVDLAGAARDEAVEQAVERNGHLNAILTTQFESHEKQNDADFHSIESTIRETAANVTTELKDELAKERVLNEQRFSAVMSEIAKLRADSERNLAELRADFEQRFGELRGEMGELRADFEQRIGELRGEMGEMRGEFGNRMMVLGLGLAGLVVGAAGVVIAAVAIFTGG